MHLHDITRIPSCSFMLLSYHAPAVMTMFVRFLNIVTTGIERDPSARKLVYSIAMKQRFTGSHFRASSMVG